MKVVLPAPLGPISPKAAPRGISSVIPSSARTAGAPMRGYDLLKVRATTALNVGATLASPKRRRPGFLVQEARAS